MRDAVAIEQWLAVPIQRFGRGSLAPRPGLVTVGDSAAFIDPFTGSGILMALESSRILAGAIERQWQSGPLELASEYQQMYATAFDNRLRWSSMLRHASFNTTVAEVMVAGLGLSAPLRKRIARLTRLSAENIYT
jgi:flavin-dependent dehydrogenase